MSRFAPTHAYLASDELAAVWRQFKVDNDAFWAAAKQWENEHPDSLKVFVSRYSYGWGYEVRGFVHPETGPAPSGFTKVTDPRRPLYPYEKHSSGKPWRDLLATFPRPPRIERRLDKFGIRDQEIPNEGGGWGSHWMVWPTIADFGDAVYVATAAEHPPCEHLTPIPLSRYHAAKERHEAA